MGSNDIIDRHWTPCCRILLYSTMARVATLYVPHPWKLIGFVHRTHCQDHHYANYPIQSLQGVLQNETTFSEYYKYIHGMLCDWHFNLVYDGANHQNRSCIGTVPWTN